MERNLLRSLVRDGFVTTTRAKARLCQRKAERLLTWARKGTLAARRQVIAALGDSKLAHRVVEEIMPSLGNRTSGFTRILVLGRRRGDGAEMARLEFTEVIKLRNLNKAVESEETASRKPKRARGSRKPPKRSKL